MGMKWIKTLMSVVVGLIVAALLFGGGAYFTWQGTTSQLAYKVWNLSQAENIGELMLEKTDLEVKLVEVETIHQAKVKGLNQKVAVEVQKNQLLKEQVAVLQEQLNNIVTKEWAPGKDFEDMNELYSFLATVDVHETDYEIPSYVCSGFGFHLMTKAKQAGYRVYPMLLSTLGGNHMRNFAVVKEVPQSLVEALYDYEGKTGIAVHSMAVEIEPETLCVWVVALFMEDGVTWADELNWEM